MTAPFTSSRIRGQHSSSGRGSLSAARYSACLAALAVLIFSGAARAQSAASAERRATLIQFFGGGSPLTPEERAQIARLDRQYFAALPRQAADEDALNAKIIATLNKRDPRMTAKLRSIARFTYATPFASALPAQRMVHDQEARIVAAHDPVVVVDATHKGVISMHVVDLMLQVNAAAAPYFGVPVPSGLTADRLATRIKADFPALPADMQAAMATTELNMPNGLPWLRGLPAQKRDAFVAQFKPAIAKASDPAEQQVRLAEAMAAADLAGARTYDAGVQKLMLRSFFLSRLRMQGLAQGALNSTARGY